MDINLLRKRLSEADIEAHVTELSERGAFLLYFEQGSFSHNISTEALRSVEGVLSIEQKSLKNPYIFRVTVTTNVSSRISYSRSALRS